MTETLTGLSDIANINVEYTEVDPDAVDDANMDTYLPIGLERVQIYDLSEDALWGHVIIEKSSQSLCSLPTQFVLEKDISSHSLVKEICHQGTSKHYLNMLKMLSEIKHESLCQ